MNSIIKLWTLASLGLMVLISCGAVSQPESKPNQEKNLAKLTTKRVYDQISMAMPVSMLAHSGTWYLVEQAGLVSTFPVDKNQGTSKKTFLDLRDQVVSGGERGLLGFALHPLFPSKNEVFVNYTANINGKLHTIVSRFLFTASPASVKEERLLTIEQPYANHNGGHIAFGPDGFLYIAMGDGGSGGDPHGHGQNTKTLLGSILRIDVNTKAPNLPYGIPSDNPFVNGGGRAEIYAYGLRNPWKFSFDTKNGDLWAADVGQNKWEEVNLIVKGGNYGWNVREADHCFLTTPCNAQGLIDPVFSYSHSEGNSITGGFVYHGQAIPALQGHYVFGDFITGRLWGLKKNGSTFAGISLPKTNHLISAFAQDEQGEVYILDYGVGQLHQLVSP